jgi:BirA family transcriptional regulator, biotin operon repressor / biotin---[acetyl-CoA-carboxylase] ligase
MQSRLFLHDVVDSTSERAFAALAAGDARHGDLHVARAQTAGRGRLGKTWHSPPGEGLYASFVLLPGPPPWPAPAATMAAGLAVRDAVRALGLGAARLKWPNDVVVDGAKLAGILVETRGLVPERPHYVVGIGVDVLQREFPPGLLAERAVTSLARQGLACSVEDVRDAVLAALGPRLDSIRAGLPALERDYLDAAGLALGRSRVRVLAGGRELAGTLVALSVREGVRVRADDASLEAAPLELVHAVNATS